MIEQLRGVLVLTVLYMAGALAEMWLATGIPGAVIGMVLCLAAMAMSPALQDAIRPGAMVMLGLLPLFLVPLLARMALVLDFTSAATWRAVAATAVCSLAGLAITGLAARGLLPAEAAE